MRWIILALAAGRGGPIGHASTFAAPTLAPAPRRVVTVTARDHALEAPDTIANGVVTFRLHDRGPTEHHLIVFRLHDGVSLREFFDGMRAGIAAPAGVTALGGPGNLGGPITRDG